MNKPKTGLEGVFNLAETYSRMWNICAEVANSKPLEGDEFDTWCHYCRGHVSATEEFGTHADDCLWARSKNLVQEMEP